ncbi:UPF0415 protein C7orf25 homolog [Schistocerca gregaria]|uniref:UPF0415 protein C7orf25 homolog n=1 Tax=Schistocerca gregaria TaxID=7010 RepID=UPI00211DF461|nr:UPF0415 protein C7orf25 homolog [Schistocerca gregaria]
MSDTAAIAELQKLTERYQSLISKLNLSKSPASFDEQRESFSKTEGINKLLHRITSELSFLNILAEKVKENNDTLERHATLYNNLAYYEALVVRLLKERPENVDAIFKVYHLEESEMANETPTNHNLSRCEVDIVCNGGASWIKIKAISLDRINWLCEHPASFEQEVFKLAKKLVKTASQNTVHYRHPLVIFHFSHGVTAHLAHQLQSIDIHIEGLITKCSCHELSVNSNQLGLSDYPNSRCLSEVGIQTPTCVNFDVTSLIYLTSDITNGENDYYYKNKVLGQQALEERTAPSLSKFKQFLKGKRLITTEAAYEKFMEILNLLGGTKEKSRAQNILKDIEIVPNNPSKDILLLKGRKITQLNQIIFGTAISIMATTATSNSVFVRSIREKRIMLSVYLHPARALTETSALPKRN